MKLFGDIKNMFPPIPEIPNLPKVPGVPDIPNLPKVPGVPGANTTTPVPSTGPETKTETNGLVENGGPQFSIPKIPKFGTDLLPNFGQTAAVTPQDTQAPKVDPNSGPPQGKEFLSIPQNHRPEMGHYANSEMMNPNYGQHDPGIAHYQNIPRPTMHHPPFLCRQNQPTFHPPFRPRGNLYEELGQPLRYPCPMRRPPLGLQMPWMDRSGHVVDMMAIEGRGSCFVYRAQFTYDPWTENGNPEEELNFMEGDFILVWGSLDNQGFYNGESLDGRTGRVPSDFVRPVVGPQLVEFWKNYENSKSMMNMGTDFGCLINDNFMEPVQTSPPLKLVVERQLHGSLLMAWEPPVDEPEGVEFYKVYLNGVHSSTIQAKEGTRALLERIEEHKVYRVSVRAVTNNHKVSNDAACTILVGPNPPLAPLAVKVFKITSTTVTVCWFPSNSSHSHGIILNNFNIRNVQAGIFHDVISGLSPNTSYTVGVYTEIQTDVVNKKLDDLTVHTTFQTLAKDLVPPKNVAVEPGPLKNKILVSWQPVIEEPEGALEPGQAPKIVTGYAIFAGGKKIWEIDSSKGDHALLDLNNPYFRSGEMITVRTKYGNFLSGDSNPCSPHLTNGHADQPAGEISHHFSHAEYFYGNKLDLGRRYLPTIPTGAAATQPVNYEPEYPVLSDQTMEQPPVISNGLNDHLLEEDIYGGQNGFYGTAQENFVSPAPAILTPPKEENICKPITQPKSNLPPLAVVKPSPDYRTGVSAIDHSLRELPPPPIENKTENVTAPTFHAMESEEFERDDIALLQELGPKSKPVPQRWANLLDAVAAEEKKKKKQPPKKKKNTDERPRRSLFCLTVNNPIRRLCITISEWKAFEYLILVTILATCFSLAMSTPFPNEDSNQLNDQLESVEGIFTVIFTTECFMKIIAYGLLLHPGAYLRNTWNFLDFTIVIIGVISGVLAMVEVEGFDVKALRAFRVLRPLRLVSGVPSLQVVMNSILKAIMPLAQIALLVLFVIVIYAIIGLELFSGVMHTTCRDKITGKIMDDPVPCGGDFECTNPKQHCAKGWEGPYYGIINFDNFGLAMLTVFQCITLEGWTQTLYNVNDAMGGGWQWTYFTSMVVMGAFMVMNLILGVLTGEFSKEAERIKGRMEYVKNRNIAQEEADFQGYLSWLQQAEYIAQEEDGGFQYPLHPKIIVPETPPKRKSWLQKNHPNAAKMNKQFRGVLKIITKSQAFFWLIIILVFLNTVIFASEFHGQPPWLDEFQGNGNKLFVALFTCEGLLKMYCLGLSRYFKSLFNRFDTFVVISSITEMYLIDEEIIPPIGLSVLRCTRLLRVFKVTKYWSSLSSLVSSLIKSMESIASLLVLLFLFIVIFALLGMQVFGGKFNFDPKADKQRQNFDSFAQAMLTVFQILTGEDWNEVMYLGILSFGGVASIGIVGSLYFIVLFISGNYILLNVFLAIAVDSLGDGSEPEKDEEEPPIEEEKEEGAEEEEEKGGGGEEKPAMPDASSFFVFSTTNRLRVGAYDLIHNGAYGSFILVCILISSASLGAEDPIYEDSPRNKVLEKMDVFFTTIFTTEIILKLLVFGLIFHRGAFARSPANLLDILVVSTSFLPSEGAFASIKILRICRVLRPLRAVKRLPGLQRVVQCTIVSIQTIGNIVVVTAILQFMFAVMGVQLFKGKLFSCTDASKTSSEECRGYFIRYKDGDIGRPTMEKRIFENNNFNFDSVGKAMLTLFAVSTFEGWPQMLYLSIDSWAEDRGPSYNYRKIVAVYYIVYLIIIAFFMVNIFVGFVIITFQSEGEREFEDCELDKNQRTCVAFAVEAKPLESYIPETPWQFRLWNVLTSQPFEYAIFGLILANTVTMTMKFHEQPAWFTEIMGHVNLVFSLVFAIECFVKLAAMGSKVFFRDAWNTFDFVLVWGSAIDIGLSMFEGGEGGGEEEKGFNIIKFLRLFRVARLVKLLNRSEGIRTLLYTFMKSLQALPYVVMLIVLLFFIYAVVGMQMFGKIKLDSDTEIHRNNNFQSFSAASLLLFRCATGEAWQDIMMSCINKPSVKCQEVKDEHGKFLPPELDPVTGLPVTCGGDFAFVYFVSFFFVCSFIILNLFVAVIMDNFDYLVRDWSILGAHHLSEFIELWSEKDPEACGRISHEDVVDVMKRISPPLGWGPLCPTRTVCRRMMMMNMPMSEDGTVQFNATLFAVIRSSLQIKMEGPLDEANEDLRRIIKEIWKGKLCDDAMLDELIPQKGTKQQTVGNMYAALMIQTHLRRFLRQRKIKREKQKQMKMEEAENLKLKKSKVTKRKVNVPNDLNFEKVRGGGNDVNVYSQLLNGHVVTGTDASQIQGVIV